MNNIKRKYSFRLIICLSLLLCFSGEGISFAQEQGDVLLNVPFSPDVTNGKQWLSSCVLMMLRYYNTGITADKINGITGQESINSIALLQEWAYKKHKITIDRREGRTIADIIADIDAKHPVMVLQPYTLELKGCVARLVTGYNQKKKELLLLDPYCGGKVYRMTFAEFRKYSDLSPEVFSNVDPSGLTWTSYPYSADSNDLILDVPLELQTKNNTCATMTFLMVLRYLEIKASFNEVVRHLGIPAKASDSLNYNAFNKWLKKNHGAELIMYSNGTIENITTCVKAGFPVVVIQNYSMDFQEGHNRVVAGYNFKEKVLIINDSTQIGYRYRMPFNTFTGLWESFARKYAGAHYVFMIIVPKGKKTPVTDLKGLKY